MLLSYVSVCTKTYTGDFLSRVIYNLSPQQMFAIVSDTITPFIVIKLVSPLD
jgi:hypothetical protein